MRRSATRFIDVRAAALGLTSVGVLLASCGAEDVQSEDARSDSALETPATDAANEVWFEEVAEVSGVNFTQGFGPVRFWMPEVTGSGLGLFDMDADGDLDLYALQGADLAPAAGSKAFDARNRLFENQGDGTFIDVTDAAGVGDTGFGMGCAVGDYDGDGRLDLYVTNVGDNVLYRNLGLGRFEDVTEAAGVACPTWSTSTSFVDYDLDGHLDLFVVSYIIWSPEDEATCSTARGDRTYCSPKRYQGPERDRLFRNRGDGTFEDVSDQVGLDAVSGNGLGLVWGQLDDEPGVDFYVANDGTPNQLWSGSPSGAFTDQAMNMGCALSGNGIAEAGMGVCMEDMNHDGLWDMVVTHLAGETNTYYFGARRGYRDKTPKTGTMGSSLSSTGFGVGMADFDHDGRLDVYVANGQVTHSGTPPDPSYPLAQYDQVLRGTANDRFAELERVLVATKQTLATSRGAAFGDIDNDGDVDVCVNDHRGRLRILRNVAPKVGGAATWSVLERDGLAAVGAVVRFEREGVQVQRQVQRTYSYCASNDPRLHLGLGKTPTIETVIVTWLDGTEETFGPLQAGEAATLRRGEGTGTDMER